MRHDTLRRRVPGPPEKTGSSVQGSLRVCTAPAATASQAGLLVRRRPSRSEQTAHLPRLLASPLEASQGAQVPCTCPLAAAGCRRRCGCRWRWRTSCPPWLTIPPHPACRTPRSDTERSLSLASGMGFLRERAQRARALPPEEASEDSRALVATYYHLAAAEAALCELGPDGRLRTRPGGPTSEDAGIEALVHIVRYGEAAHVPSFAPELLQAMILLCEVRAIAAGGELPPNLKEQRLQRAAPMHAFPPTRLPPLGPPPWRGRRWCPRGPTPFGLGPACKTAASRCTHST